MLEMTDDLLVDRGQLREIYLHPHDDGVIVKLPIDKTKGSRANRLELRSYREIAAKHGELDCICRCHGFVATDRGEGLVCDCIRDSDGAISATIWDLIIYPHTCDMDMLLARARAFCDFLIQRDIRLFDLNLKNIAMRRRQSGEYQAVAIDLKGRYGNNEWIPFSSHTRYFARRKMERRSLQLLERMVYFRAHRHEFLEK